MYALTSISRLREGSRRSSSRVRRFIDDWQDPETGFWGAWYRDGDQIYRTSDLSITFHIVSYRNGKVDRKVAIDEHLLASKYEDYPYGWFKDGRMSNHNNYDVVKILRLIWKDLPDSLQDKFRVQIEHYDLGAAIELAPGWQRGFLPRYVRVKHRPRYYYLVSFLEEIGFPESRSTILDRRRHSGSPLC